MKSLHDLKNQYMVKEQKKFNMFLHSFQELNTITIDGKRHYETPVGTFPSVTTKLSMAYDSSWLEDWKKHVGEEWANEESTRAKVRGQTVHKLCEDYITGNLTYELTPIDFLRFNSVKSLLDENLSEVYGIEACVYSKVLESAGRFDLCGKYKGKVSIIDYKGSNKEKKPEEIETYFVQATAYSIMIEEIYGIKIDQIVILMFVDNGPCLEFIETPEKFKQLTLEKFIN